MVTTSNLPTENGRYFLVGPDKQVIVVNQALFESVARFSKPNRKFGKVEIIFKNGAVCDVMCTEHLMNVGHLNSGQ